MDELTLSELFELADRIGSKYQDEIAIESDLTLAELFAQAESIGHYPSWSL